MTKPVFDDEFKQGVVDYVNQHPEESKISIAKKFGIADSTIHKWVRAASKNGNKIESRGSGNFSSDEAKEIARLSKEPCFAPVLFFFSFCESETTGKTEKLNVRGKRYGTSGYHNRLRVRSQRKCHRQENCGGSRN